MDTQSMLRQLPKVDRLLEEPSLAAHPHRAAVEASRAVLEALRAQLLAGERTSVPSAAQLAVLAAGRLEERERPHLRAVLNATGVALHTNLGRAPLAPEAVAAAQLSAGYSNLEYELEAGGRGSRFDHVTGLLRSLTGAEDAMVVNNNAAAVLLMLSALAAGGEVVLSRGELVEIGGSFRVPDVMEQSGARLREVGATNKTRLADYRAAVGAETRALLKVHTSNYRIVGFTEEATLAELAVLAQEKELPLLCDLGSGLLRPLPIHLLTQEGETVERPLPEPSVADCLAAGADLVAFSGDKLLGGPQAGILVGKARWLAPLKRHPLARAIRVDKLTLAALEATLRLYRSPEEAARRVPVLRMLTCPPEELRRRAEELRSLLAARCVGWEWDVVSVTDRVGGGSAPDVLLPGWAVAVRPKDGGLERLETALRLGDPPLVGRAHRGSLLLSLRTLDPTELEPAAGAVARALEG